ncbi:ribitol-5-phosphate xylosyltransferase 1 [Nilaparvata lugens]|uniref:ribitol-5-phosphate xylosyltransferase 1 n=1 Tax=Nilaparvata lugens TaxID=108931 RepID=UPI00193EB11F|nr:ribitol-5-phosphate xylosyltransferase 1 [Nilaparvata lugens]
MWNLIHKYEMLVLIIFFYVVLNTMRMFYAPPIMEYETSRRISKPLNIISTNGYVYRYPEIPAYRQNEIETYNRFDEDINVEIWGKAAISMYLWEHILRGKLKQEMLKMKNIGSIKANGMTINYKHGPWYIQTTVPRNVQHLVLVLNGRAPQKVVLAKQWLDYLHNFKYLTTLIIVLHANEQCDNEWILPYMKSNNGKIDAVFLTYDSTLVDDKEFFQWPLGVASYRGFEFLATEKVNMKRGRNYICNFIGTMYENSTRTKLQEIVNSVVPDYKCPIKGRKHWTPEESQGSSDYYKKVIHQSDTTLCPVGMNPECYRIYEALSLGSLPIVEDNTTPGNCDSNPLRLLKKHNAPFFFIKDWGLLPSILESEMNLTEDEKEERRRTVMIWYKKFKQEMKETFLSVLKSKIEGNLKMIRKDGF